MESSELLGIPQSTYAQYERGGRSIPDEIKVKLAESGINLHWLLTGEGSMFREGIEPIETLVTLRGERHVQSGHIVSVPILAQHVSAGGGQEWIDVEEPEARLPVLSKLVDTYPKDKLRAVEVRGDSMRDISLTNGDLAIFVAGLIEGNGIYVLENGGALFVERLDFDPAGDTVNVISENSSYEIRVYSASADIVRIQGKVVGWIHRNLE